MLKYLGWTLLLCFFSGYSFGKYFFAKSLVRQKKILATEIDGGVRVLFGAFGGLLITSYLYAKYFMGVQTHSVIEEIKLVFLCSLPTLVVTTALFLGTGNLPNISNNDKKN